MSPAAFIAFQIATDASTWSASVVLMNRSKVMPSFSCIAWNASELRRASSEVGMPSAAAVCAMLCGRSWSGILWWRGTVRANRTKGVMAPRW